MTRSTGSPRLFALPPAGALSVRKQWAEPMAEWVGALRAAGRAESTIRSRVEHLRWLARDHPSEDPWALRLVDLVAWCGRHDWARETRRAVRASLRGFYSWAHGSGYCADNPAAGLPPIPPSQPRPRPTPDQEYRLALMAADERERLMLRLAAEIGLRRAEVAAVHTDDVIEDLLGRSLRVVGKGNKERVLPLPDALAAEIRRRPHGYLFPGECNGHLSPRWVGKLVTRLLPDGMTMHGLRHRFGSRAYAVDRDLLTVQALLGHASPVTTRTYVEIPNESLRRTVLAAA